MKNLNLAINIVLAIGLGVLFVMHFALLNNIKHGSPKPIAVASGSNKIVYIDLDSLLNNYDMAKDMEAKLNQKRTKLSDELNAKKRAFENSAASFQDKVQKGLLLRSEAEKIQEQLSNEQQNLINLNSNMTNQFQEEAMLENRKVMYSITEFLKEYNKDGFYNFIFSTGTGSNLLYTNDSLNITKDVLKGLNEKYSKEIKK
jgi:outer membrane protein